MFHRFKKNVSGVMLPERFNNPFFYRPHPLCELAAAEVRELLYTSPTLAVDAACGKMLGVLVVRDACGVLGYVAGFSGLLGGSNKQEGFVPPVFDFLAPYGYFKQEETRISDMNRLVSALKNSSEYAEACEVANRAEREAQAKLDALHAAFAENKAKRADRRAQGAITAEEAAAFVRSSQFEKAELKRVAARCRAEIADARAALDGLEERLRQLATERKRRSQALQEWLFGQFRVLNALGEEKSLLEIFSEKTGTLPPAGAGECAAPKMLQYAYLNKLQPVAMAEFWVGASPVGEVRHDGCFYGSCKSKCHPILSFMLQGVNVEEAGNGMGCGCVEDTEVIYEDDCIVVVDKPHGVLSVPGIEGGTSVQEWLRARIGSDDVFVAHRLDMATSGLLVAAKSISSLKFLQAEFAARRVSKRYTAVLERMPERAEGEISLPLAPDYDNRPRMKVDFERGKPALTYYKLLRTVATKGGKRAVLSLVPVTGRTHQLRVHCAHKSGLDIPIVGDAIYGRAAERLMLNAEYISFVHPVSGKRVEFFSAIEL